METREYLHGPLEAVTPEFGCVVFGRDREQGLAAELGSFGATVALISDTAPTDVEGVHVIGVPEVTRLAAPILQILPASCWSSTPPGCAAWRSASSPASSRTPRSLDGPGGESRRGSSSPAVTVIGCVQADVLMSPVTELPAPGGTSLTDQMNMRVGGAGANAALAFAEAGHPVRLIGCVGDDQLGRWMQEQLEPFGLADELVVLGGAGQRADGRARVPGARPHVPHLSRRQRACGSRR